MEHGNGDNPDWPMQRRVEGFVNKHMADIAREALQQRLTAVSDEMHNLAERVSRRSGEEFKDDARQGDVSFGVEPPLCSACSSGAADKLLSAPSTATKKKAEHKKTGGGPAPPHYTPAEEPALGLNANRPIVEGIPGGSSSLDLKPGTKTAAQRKIIGLLVEIQEEQQRQWAVLRDLQARLQGPGGYEEEDVEALDMDLPLRTLEQLDDMERQLDDAGIQKRMVSYLSRMGGATVEDAVRRLMQAVLSFAVGSELNWVGRGQKRSFRNTRLQGVLFCALKRTPVGKEATHHQYADVVKKWLRFAPFRQGGTGRRCYKAPVEFPDSEEAD